MAVVIKAWLAEFHILFYIWQTAENTTRYTCTFNCYSILLEAVFSIIITHAGGCNCVFSNITRHCASPRDTDIIMQVPRKRGRESLKFSYEFNSKLLLRFPELDEINAIERFGDFNGSHEIIVLHSGAPNFVEMEQYLSCELVLNVNWKVFMVLWPIFFSFDEEIIPRGLVTAYGPF